jgi:type IV secretion system protein VirD4
MKAMRNYAGHRLSPWLGHLMVSRSETPRPLMTPGEIMQLPPADEIVMVAGIPPIRARKARYFEDTRFRERILPPPRSSARKEVHTGDWSALPLPPTATTVGVTAARHAPDEDTTDSEQRHQPELSLARPVPNVESIANEFELDGDGGDDLDNLAAQNRQLTGVLQGVARQASLDFGDGMEI